MNEPTLGVYLIILNLSEYILPYSALEIGLSQNRASDTFKHQDSEFGLPHISPNLKLYSGSRPARLLKGGLENINSN